VWNKQRRAATWGNGSTGVSGTVSEVNSLVDSNLGDFIGGYVVQLSNGNYLILSANGGRGAATWGNGSTGVSGVVSEANSLVGSNPGDQVGTFFGYRSIILLSNGNYLVQSPTWNGNRGAVTWGDGNTGVSGVVSDANSLVGSNTGDVVGAYTDGSVVYSTVTVLTDGNYVVGSPLWNGYTGAATWGNGSTGVSGVVSDANSLVGNYFGDGVGSVTPLRNGNYVVDSPFWNGATGAVTLGDGNSGVSGIISPLRDPSLRSGSLRSAQPTAASEGITESFGSRVRRLRPKVTGADLSLKKPLSWSKEWGPLQCFAAFTNRSTVGEANRPTTHS
jgi:Repeat of unknown function (DUF5650)